MDVNVKKIFLESRKYGKPFDVIKIYSELKNQNKCFSDLSIIEQFYVARASEAQLIVYPNSKNSIGIFLQYAHTIYSRDAKNSKILRFRKRVVREFIDKLEKTLDAEFATNENENE